MKLNFKNKKPYVHSSAFVASNAVITGDISIAENASLLFGVCARGDINYIKIGSKTNIQDNSTLHVTLSHPCIIGNNCVIGHNAVVHGCKIKDNVMIGMGAIVLNGAQIGENSIVAAGALVKENSIVPPNSLVVGVPGKIIRNVSEEEKQMIKDIVNRYIEVSQEYKKIENT